MKKKNFEIIPFDFKGSNVRTIIDKDGNPWWMGKEICTILGIQAHRDALGRIDSEDKKGASVKLDGWSQEREITIINESGLYNLILGSNKPKAKEFKRWITHEVLPTIRKTGGYINNVDLFMDTLFKSVPEESKPAVRQMIETTLKAQKELEVAAPKIEFYEALMESSDSFDVGTAAKILNFPGIGRNLVFKTLRERGILMEGGEKHNIPKQEFINRGWFQVVIKQREHTGQMYTKVYVFGKGMKAIRDILNED